MKTLTLLRHAKSSWNDPVARDFDRPLNGRGKRAAVVMGRHLRGLAGFDTILASPAVRVVETLEHAQTGYGETLAPVWDKRVYLASAATLLDLVRELPDSADSALLVGHNPGMEELVLLLVADRDDDALRGAVEEKFPTASVAVMTFDVAHWADLAKGSATLTSFTRPRDLDESLGPDRD